MQSRVGLGVISVCLAVIGACSGGPTGTCLTPDAADNVGQDLVPMPEVVINEVSCHGTDFVELFNASGDSVADLSGFVISDGDGASHRYGIPPGTLLPPLGRFVVTGAEGRTGGLPFGILCGRDTIQLLDRSGVVVDEVLLPLVMKGTGWSRLPDGSADWAEGTLTPNAVNQPAPDLNEMLFNPLRVHTIDLNMPPSSIDALWMDSATYVPGTFSLQTGETTEGPVPVGLRLKGRYGSFQTLDGKAAFKVKFNFDGKDGRFNGLKKLTLNNMVQDPSMIHEVMAYRIFSAFGVPCPRTGYAWVTVNGEPYGLYLVLEPTDDVAMSRHFPLTQHVYEGEYGEDIVPSMVAQFEIDEGAKSNVDDLTLLANVSYQAEKERWASAVSPLGDLDEWRRMWAVEMFIGHWDGYAPTINNYYLHSDDQGVFSMMPSGADQTFGDDLPYHQGGGYLFARCMQDPACRLDYGKVLGDLLAVIDSLDLDAMAVQVSQAVAPWVETDTRKPYETWDVAAHVQYTRDFLVNRRGDLEGRLGCWLDPLADLDGDGLSCESDCDEGDPTTYVGAYDVCGDGIDQDCNGTADDAFECPDCMEVWRGPHLYLVCPTWRNRDEAVIHCQNLGTELVVVDGPEENTWLVATLGKFGVPECWLGISDVWQEGTWIADAGHPVEWFSWEPGQPDNWGEAEHCAEFFDWGEWNDLACLDVNPVVCEMPCTPGQDEDLDGALRCDSDCDDGNASVHPGAVDVCGDGLDNDCDGRVDNGPGCIPLIPMDTGSAPGEFLYLDMDLPRDEARKVCLEHQPATDLAWFDSLDQLIEVRTAITSMAGEREVWIGIDDMAREGVYTWVSGTEVEFTNWAPNQPNNGAGGRDQDCCRMLGDGTWNDTDCGLAFGAICRVL
jgi:hypothetical protein